MKMATRTPGIDSGIDDVAHHRGHARRLIDIGRLEQRFGDGLHGRKAQHERQPHPRP